ncbi:MAG: hypothetical protein V1736_04335 [Pseudomonadota bacterium]
MYTRAISRLLFATVLVTFLASGCATRICAPKSPNQPVKTKLSEFDAVVLSPSVILEPYSQGEMNRRATRKIDENITLRLKEIFPKLVTGENAEEAPGGRVLKIEPIVEEIKFINAAARVWVGPLAGSSAVRMKVIYRDLSTGEIIADPSFFKKGNAMAGTFTVGTTDNMMLVQITDQIAAFTTDNL